MNTTDTRVSEVMQELTEAGDISYGFLRQTLARMMMLFIAEADQSEGVTALQMVEAIEGAIPQIRAPRVSYKRSAMNGTGKLALTALRNAGFVEKRGNRYFLGPKF